MGEQRWLESWTGQSVHELLFLANEYRADSIVLAFEQAIQSKEGSLSRVEQIVLAIEGMEREVNNGGYSQFFRNCPEYAPVIVKALKAIGCADAAVLTQKAIAALGLEPPLIENAVRQAIESTNDLRDAELAKFDNDYYETSGDVAGALLEFIKDNKDQVTFE